MKSACILRIIRRYIFLRPFLIKQTCRVVKHGDVDLNGQVNNNDVVLIQRYLAGVGEFTEENIIAGDVNTDGEVDIVDATLINRFIIGLITSFPVE